MLPTRHDSYGVNQYFVNQKHKVLPTGDGSKKVICGRSCGLISPLFQNVANNCPRVDANLNALEDANATALVLLARHCVAADVKIRLCFNPEHKLVDYTCNVHLL